MSTLDSSIFRLTQPNAAAQRGQSVGYDTDGIDFDDGEHVIVLHHGLGFGKTKWGPLHHKYFKGMDDAIAARWPMILPCVHPTGGIARRARELRNEIEQELACRGLQGRKLIIIGHSMGGLDARYMISRLGMDEKVAALLTITTPHRGSSYADWVLHHLGRRLGLLKLIDWMGLDLGAMQDLTVESCARFNEEVVDAPDVQYYCVSASQVWRKMPILALHSWNIVNTQEGDNDGLVSLTSSRWGQHLDTWQADHWHTINHRYHLNRDDDVTPLYLRAVRTILGHLRHQLRR